MSTNSLKELYIEELQDLYSANQMMNEMVEKLTGVASDAELVSMLDNSRKKIADHNQKLRAIIQDHGEDPEDETCKGMAGLVAEARRHTIDENFNDNALRDASIISQMQRMTHYGIAGYGTVRALAKNLGFKEDLDRLGADLKDIYAGDTYLTRIAESDVNQRAS